jgi:hypothetical protein
MNRSWLAMVPAVATLLCAPPAAAQTFALDEDRPNVLWAEIQRPAFRGDQYLSAWLGFVGVRYQFASQLSVLAGLPFAQVEVTAHDVGGTRVAGTTSTALGNPYLGLRFGLPWQTVAVDAVVGVRLGQAQYAHYGYQFTEQDVVGLAGAQGDWDRFEAFIRSDAWSGRVTALLSRHLSESLSLHLRAGAAFVRGKGIPFEAAATTTYRQRRMVASAGVTYRTRIADDVYAPGGSGGPGPVQLALGLGWTTGRTTPTVFVRVPLGGSTPSDPLARHVVGVSATLPLGGPHGGF